MDKKAQGMPLNVIIIAILVMLVLVVLGVIFMVRMGFFTTKVTDCELQGSNYKCSIDYRCQTDSAGTAIDGYMRDTTGLTCKKLDGQTPQYCCFKIGG
jgi:hypothetical protein